MEGHGDRQKWLEENQQDTELCWIASQVEGPAWVGEGRFGRDHGSVLGFAQLCNSYKMSP